MSHVTQTTGLVRWLSAVVAILALSAAWEAFLGHYRSGFSLKAQYVPIGTAAVLFAAGVATMVLPTRTAIVLEISGWLGIITGLVGVGYHHYYGIVEKPAGYRWLLHHVMYHAPPLAPLTLAALGALALLSGRLATGGTDLLGLTADTAVMELCAIVILGASLQAGILHYRGAYNNALMYVPVTVPLIAVIALASHPFVPSQFGNHVAIVSLWLTFLSGFAGVGMHLRGIDRQMGGLYILRQNLMQGPPVSAPLTFAGFAAAALAVLYLR